MVRPRRAKREPVYIVLWVIVAVEVVAIVVVVALMVALVERYVSLGVTSDLGQGR